jgi:hypothetical protein
MFREGLQRWKKSSSPEVVPSAFSSQGNHYWVGFQPLQSDSATTWIAVIIPETDLVGNLQQRWLYIALLSTVILTSGAVFTFVLIRRYYTAHRQAAVGEKRKQISTGELLDLIASGENSRLEFKSTVRTNLKSGKKDKVIEFAWLKCVTAFLNSEGGTVLIGVDDDGNPVGIETDNFENDDRCLLHIKNLINEHIGIEFSRSIHYQLLPVEGKTIVTISCRPSAQAAFFRVGKNEEFYIRSGPSSLKLPMSKIVPYLNQRNQDRKPS